MDQFIRQLCQQTCQALTNLDTNTTQWDESRLQDQVEIPPDPQMGDFALPCFQFAKTLKRSPTQIAQALQTQLAENKERLQPFSQVQAICISATCKPHAIHISGI